ncbi:hypothetical protein [Streptomyces sp. NPDC056160]
MSTLELTELDKLIDRLDQRVTDTELATDAAETLASLVLICLGV